MPKGKVPYRDGQGACLTCSGPCDVRAQRCRGCSRRAVELVCPGCQTLVPREAMTSATGRRLSYCPPCMAAWYRNNRYVSRYGITTEEYERMFAEQDGRCAICGTAQGRDRLHFDHCHLTGTHRKLLCFHCNAGIGHFNDDPERLMCAAQYLLQARALLAD